MRPYLLIDFGERTLSALVLTAEGHQLPCSQQIRQTSSRYFSSEVLFDPRLTEGPHFAWEDAVEELGGTDARKLFRRLRRLGLHRPWDLDDPNQSLLLPSPLAVLSSPAALVDTVVEAVLAPACIALLEALLAPLFDFLPEHGIAVSECEVLAIVPAHTGRQARLALQKALRRQGSRSPQLLSREVAAAMALVSEPPGECLVCDLSATDLHLHRVAILAEGTARTVRTVQSATVRGLGWPHVVQQVANALRAQGLLPGAPEEWLTALDRALSSLLGSPSHPTVLPTAPPLALTLSLLHHALAGRQVDALQKDLRGCLEPHLATLGDAARPVILLGAAGGLAPIQNLLIAATGGQQAAATAGTPALERPLRGLAQALLWLREDSRHSLSLPPCGSLRLNTFVEGSAEILPAAKIPPPGEHSYLRRCFRVGASSLAASRHFMVQLQWGTDPLPEGNANLLTLPLEIAAGREMGGLTLDLCLRRSASGRRLTTTLTALYDGELSAPAPLRASFSTDFVALPSLRDKENL